MIRIAFNVDRKDLYNFGWMLLFILGIYIFTNYIVMKDLDNFIEMRSRYNFQKTFKSYIQENLQSAQAKYIEYKNFENYLLTMEQEYDQNMLKELLSNYFNKIDRLELIERRKKDHIIEEHYLVQIVMTTPRAFFDFLDGIKERSLPFEIKKPIQFQKKNGIIAIFEFVVYTVQ